MNSLSWDDFRLIKAIAEAGGLTGASVTLSVNHSTVFRRLGQIEEAMGLPLFERRKTGYVATPAGEEMAALAARIDEDVSAFVGASPARDRAVRRGARHHHRHALPAPADPDLPVAPGGASQHPARHRHRQPGAEPVAARRRHRDPRQRFAARDAGRPQDRAARLGDLRPRGGCARAPEAIDQASLFERDWVSFGDQLGHIKAARYVKDRVAPGAHRAQDLAVLGIAEAIEAGIGVGALPCFIGDTRPGLKRLMPPNPSSPRRCGC